MGIRRLGVGRPMVFRVPQWYFEDLNGSIVLVDFMVFFAIETQIFPRNRRVDRVRITEIKIFTQLKGSLSLP
jgi:hypothetical protein